MNLDLTPSREMSGQRVLLSRLVYAWLLISALYYASTLFTGRFQALYSVSEFHKGFKYAAALGLSAWIASAVGVHRTVIASMMLLAVAATLVLLNGSLSISAVTLLSNAAFLGFILLIRVLDGSVSRLTSVLIWSGVLVSLGSIVELTLLRGNLLTYWSQTGGVRSISTLLNPNNLGLYQGACLTLWGYMFNKGRASLFPGVILMFSLVASGSRTAMVAMMLMAVVAVVWDRSIFAAIKARVKAHAIAFFCLATAGIVSVFAVDSISATENIESYKRGTDLHTLELRAKFANRFIEASDWTLLAPDIHRIREVFVQDNAFLSLLNSHGFIVVGMLCWLLITIPRQITQADPEDLWAYRHLLVFYLVSGLSNSFLNSFPNNQLFFIAIGAWLCSASMTSDSRTASSFQIRRPT